MRQHLVAALFVCAVAGWTAVGYHHGKQAGEKHRDAEMKEVIAFREHGVTLRDWTLYGSALKPDEGMYTFNEEGGIEVRGARNREGRVLVVGGNGSLQILPFIIPDDSTKIVIQGNPVLHKWWGVEK